MDVLAQISPIMVRSAAIPPSLLLCLPAEGDQNSTHLFSLVIIVILLPLTTWIKQTCLVILAEQIGLDGSPIIYVQVLLCWKT